MAVATVAVCALAARPAAAQDAHCPPHQGKTTIEGNLLVAAACKLDETRVNGNVELYAGGSLVARDATIDGNIEAHTAFEVELIDSRVRGNVELIELVGDSTSLVDSRVDGNIKLRSNRSFVVLENNDVDSIEALGNTGGLDILENDVDGDLECRENNPAPTGSGNDVRGDEEGQCRNLVARNTAVSADDSSGDDTSDDSSDDGPAQGTGSGSTGGTGSTAGTGSSGSDVPPINFINEPSGGGGSVDVLMLLTAIVLLARRRVRFGRPHRELEVYIKGDLTIFGRRLTPVKHAHSR